MLLRRRRGVGGIGRQRAGRAEPRLGRGTGLDAAPVDRIDQLPQAAQTAAIEAKDQPRVRGLVGLFFFFRQRTAQRKIARR